MELILVIIGTTLGAWLIISPVVYISWHFNRDVRHQYKKYVYIVCLGTLISLTSISGAGLTLLLFFIPESWGSPDIVMRVAIGFATGLLAATHFMKAMSKTEEIEDKKKALRHELEINRRINDLSYLNLLKPSKEKDESHGLQDIWTEGKIAATCGGLSHGDYAGTSFHTGGNLRQ